VQKTKCTVLGFLFILSVGKTTLASIILEDISASEGTITKATGQRRVGYCPQFDVLWPDLTILEHLTLLASATGCRQQDALARGKSVASLVGLQHPSVIHTASKDLSGGMKRRLSLAMALMGDVQLVIMDEPTTGVDPVSRQMVWQMINAVRQRLPDLTLLLNTHDTDEATVLCDRVGILNNGRLCYLSKRDNQLNVNNAPVILFEGSIPITIRAPPCHPLDQTLEQQRAELIRNLCKSLETGGSQHSLPLSIHSCQLTQARLLTSDTCTCIATFIANISGSCAPSLFLPNLIANLGCYRGAQWRIGCPQLSDVFEQTVSDRHM
jgi:ABC-type multidrug transport system ATPase subunit